jgi:hypothetical protein
MAYRKLLLMSIISFVVMYGVMYLNVDSTSHIYVNLTRTYMSLLMVLPMVLLMILFMGKMYPNKKLNNGIILGSIVLFGIVLGGLRSQTPMGDIQYMKAMIPHHSSAIMTSKNADIKDPEVKSLSEKIIKSQEEEIMQMKAMIERLEQ